MIYRCPTIRTYSNPPSFSLIHISTHVHIQTCFFVNYFFRKKEKLSESQLSILISLFLFLTMEFYFIYPKKNSEIRTKEIQVLEKNATIQIWKENTPISEKDANSFKKKQMYLFRQSCLMVFFFSFLFCFCFCFSSTKLISKQSFHRLKCFYSWNLIFLISLKDYSQVKKKEKKSFFRDNLCKRESRDTYLKLFLFFP